MKKVKNEVNRLWDNEATAQKGSKMADKNGPKRTTKMVQK
jgi:hypothetical protein